MTNEEIAQEVLDAIKKAFYVVKEDFPELLIEVAIPDWIEVKGKRFYTEDLMNEADKDY